MVKNSLFILLLLLGLACTKASQPETVPPVGLAGSGKVTPNKVYDGVVSEVIEKDQFDYIRIDQTWFALVGTSLKAGQKVKIEAQVAFDNFHSKTLNRTFPKIIFGKLLSPQPVNGPKRIETH
jgi:hypothetical protein